MSREATLDDIPQLVVWGAKFHEMAKLNCPYEPEATATFLGHLINSDQATVIMHDHGFIGGMLSPAYCAPDWVMAVELFWWAEKRGLSLLRDFERWAEGKGANEVRMTTLYSLPTADTILRRLGYVASEISYSKVT